MRKDVLAGAAAVGAALIGGAAVYYLRLLEPPHLPFHSSRIREQAGHEEARTRSARQRR